MQPLKYGLGRVLSNYDKKWLTMFELMKQYKEKYGDCLVVTSDPNLGVWVSNQRQQYKYFNEGKKAMITQARIDMLNSIDFVWVAGGKKMHMDIWLKKFEMLKQYKEKHGDCLVLRSDPNLGRWVGVQRTHYKYFNEGKKLNISQERIDMLNSIDFVWDTRKGTRYDE